MEDTAYSVFSSGVLVRSKALNNWRLDLPLFCGRLRNASTPESLPPYDKGRKAEPSVKPRAKRFCDGILKVYNS